VEQRHVGAELIVGMSISGLYSDKTNVTFDDFQAARGEARDAKAPRIGGVADAALSSGTLLVTGSTRGGEAVVDNFSGGAYTVQVDYDLNGGNEAYVWIHYVDANNGYRVYFDVQEIWLDRVQNGQVTRLYTSAVGGSGAQTVAVRYETSGPRVRVFAGGTDQFNIVDANLPSGGVALGGASAKFDNLKIGYDNNSDGDLNDAGDDLVMSEAFGSTSKTVTHDHTGNLIDDGTNQFVYDAWNRLVKVRSAQTTTLTIQTAEFDGTGRRIKKVVTNSGEFDGTTVYFYNGSQILETRNGSGNMVQQWVYRGYIPDPDPQPDPGCQSPIVTMRVKNKGDVFIHQDAVGNIVALTDLGGSIVERYAYTPYGELTVHQDTSYGDRDGDQDVDSADKGTVGSTCTGTVSGACRILDLDFDADYDSADASLFDALTQGLARHPGKASSGVDQPFGRQGLLYEPEVAQYQNWARQYDPRIRRFLQRDPYAIANGPGRGYADGMGLYAYVRGNPIIFADPSGAFVSPESMLNPIVNPLRVVVNTVFWGAGAATVLVPAAEQQLVYAWNGVATGRPYFFHEDHLPTRYTAEFSFPSQQVGSLIVDSICCASVQNESFQCSWSHPCFEAILNKHPDSVAIYVAPDVPLNISQHQPGQASVGERSDLRRACVAGNWITPGFLNTQLLPHELGHLMGGLHSDESGLDHLAHIMTSSVHNRNLACHNVVDVLHRHQLLTDPSGQNEGSPPPPGPWRCLHAAPSPLRPIHWR
jgi:RHS repeat-associated protein